MSRYGEDLLRPTLVGIVIVFLSTMFWLTRSNFNLQNQPPITSISTNFAHNITSTHSWQKAFERSLIDFIPLLPSGSDVKLGLIEYVIKIVGGAVTFGLIAIALRRKFERNTPIDLKPAANFYTTMEASIHAAAAYL